MAQEALVQVDELSGFYDRHCAVDGVSFELRQGEIMGFLGPNGAGKTTVMQILTGNLALSGGRVAIAGNDIVDDSRAAKTLIGYLPEQPPVYPDLTVDEYLAYCARLRGIRRRALRDARALAKERCGLAGAGGRLIGNLSKGYRQRVGIAQAIIHSPEVVVLDEPTVGLDPIQMRAIRALIRELGARHSVILSTHILPEVQAVCDRVQIIHRGRLVFADGLGGLTRRMRSQSVLLRLERPPDTPTLACLPHITGVEAAADGALRLYHDPETDPRAVLAEAAVGRGWGLLELTPERKSLEQIFVDLTTGEEAQAAA